ncbi:alpha/beta fold hydrolase [Streptomyces sp. NPDC046557]|uniref:alpha/beta hydrolase family protein n=1 Tax=Streptomyces sp. NPDC046557 TaxID=3155372 RepID=UPI0033E216A3
MEKARPVHTAVSSPGRGLLPGRTSGPLSAAVAAVVVAVAGGCASPHPAAHPAAGDVPPPAVALVGDTYRVPEPLPSGTPGALIAATDHGPDARLAGARRWTALYHSTNAHGADVPVSGTVLLPPGAPPQGGWPVVSWGHGTTGVADACAPSQLPDLGSGAYTQELGALLRAGYAVTASDYPGLGTPGMHTYLVGADEGNAVADIVTAAHQLVPGLGRVWFAVGHSQGGQAALFAAHAAHPPGGQRLGGVVAVAPASHLEVMLAGVKASHVPGELSFALYSLAGLAATDRTDASLSLRSLLGNEAATTASRVLAGCITTSDQVLNGLDTEKTLPLSADQLQRIGERMGAYGDPDRAQIPVPALIIQGKADQDVPPAWTDQVVARLRRLGSRAVFYRTYPGAGHDQVLDRSVCDLLAFLSAHGGIRPAACTPPRTGTG